MLELAQVDAKRALGGAGRRAHHAAVRPGRWRDMHVGPLFFVAEAEAAEVQLSRLGLARLA